MLRPSLIERVLLVAGPRNSGKSTQLRAMFRDPRLGNEEDAATRRNLPDTYRLSPDRQLYLRLMSPHEAGATLEEFLDKIGEKTTAGRWCVASAVQVEATQRMPDLPTVVSAIDRRFSPERIRIVLSRRIGAVTDWSMRVTILRPCAARLPSLKSCRLTRERAKETGCSSRTPSTSPERDLAGGRSARMVGQRARSFAPAWFD